MVLVCNIFLSHSREGQPGKVLYLVYFILGGFCCWLTFPGLSLDRCVPSNWHSQGVQQGASVNLQLEMSYSWLQVCGLWLWELWMVQLEWAFLLPWRVAEHLGFL